MQPLRRSVRDLNSAPELEVSSARLRVFGGVLVLLVGVLLGRLWFLQVLRGDEFRRDADSNRSLLVREVAPRGVIEDSEKQVLVTNRAQFTVFVVPADLPKAESERKAVLTRLAQILGNSREDMEEAVRRNRARASDPIPVAEDVSIRVLSRLAENRVRLPGVTAQTEPVRYYPHRSLAGHLLGYIGQINDEELSEKENLELGYRMGDFIGRSGVERQYDALLNGEEGGTWYEIDARGRRQRELRADAPVAGATLRLSLSRGVQVAAEKALEGRRGAAVALDPRDGRVLALANGPTYDPSLFVKRPLLRREYRRLIDPRQGYKLQNRAIASPQPPGSTFKIVTAAAGLALGKISAATTDYCTGAIMLGRRARKRCHSRHGGVNLDSALAASCDVFFYHAGFRIQPTPLARWAEQFGLGRKTGIDLPSEKAGTVPSPEWKRVMAPKFGNPDTGWYPGDTANMAIGQGDVQATPLQMAQVAAAIGSGGVIYKPRVVEEALGPDKRVVYRMKPEVTHRLPLSPEHLRLVAQGMRSVVAGARGTSHAARLPDVAVAGKSGSAEIRGGGPTHAWFVCYAPYERPTIAVCVFLETTGKSLHGGADAAPIARSMLAAHFRAPAGGATGGRGGAARRD